MFDFLDMGFESAETTSTSGPYIPEASECMRCGMCVSSCPTFRLFETDEETPRRRIRTISKVLVEDQAISADERLHLDNCLQCRACETACPSRMAYGSLFDQARDQLNIEIKGLAKLALRLIVAKRWRTRLLPALSLYLKSGLRQPLRRSGLLKKLGVAEAEALLIQPALHPLAECYTPSIGQPRGRVALFTGCIAEHFDRATLQAAIALLNAIGYEVLVPREQGCCGAIHQHNGQSAETLIANNLAVFNALEVEAVLHAATGCGAMLAEYPGSDDAAEKFRARLADVNEFLLSHWPEDVSLRPMDSIVAVHEPCSQRNVLKNAESVYRLLAKIPELSVVALTDNQLCCGAGGSYMLTHPDNAGRLRSLKHQAIAAATAEVVVSANYGCAVFLDSPFARVLHPLSLLAQQLPRCDDAAESRK